MSIYLRNNPEIYIYIYIYIDIYIYILAVLKLRKGTTKLHLLHYSCVVIILFITDLYKSAFSTYSL